MGETIRLPKGSISVFSNALRALTRHVELDMTDANSFSVDPGDTDREFVHDTTAGNVFVAGGAEFDNFVTRTDIVAGAAPQALTTVSGWSGQVIDGGGSGASKSGNSDHGKVQSSVDGTTGDTGNVSTTAFYSDYDLRSYGSTNVITVRSHQIITSTSQSGSLTVAFANSLRMFAANGTSVSLASLSGTQVDIQVVIDKSAELADVFINSIEVASNVNISSLAEWHIGVLSQINVTAAPGGAYTTDTAITMNSVWVEGGGLTGTKTIVGAQQNTEDSTNWDKIAFLPHPYTTSFLQFNPKIALGGVGLIAALYAQVKTFAAGNTIDFSVEIATEDGVKVPIDHVIFYGSEA